MSKFVERCLLFYKVLKKYNSFRWDEDYEKAFIYLKEYLTLPPTLTRLKVGEILFLYIVTFEEVIEIMLIIKRDDEQKLVYYTNKVLHDAKVKYQKLKQLAYAIVLALRRLKPYSQSYYIIICIDEPIYEVL